jgi:hypothetical protein
MSAFSDKQARFNYKQGMFCVWCKENGYILTDGDAYRDPRLHGEIGVKKGYGHKSSGHKNRLARDYNLRINGFLCTKTEEYRVIGEKWLTMDEDAAWGGEWGDGNHFSFEHNGVK